MSIYQHFREEEHAFVDQVLEWVGQVKGRYVEHLTDFLDPRQQEIMLLVIGHDDEVKLSFLGGSTYSERKRAILTPPYLELDDDLFQLTLFEIVYPAKFITLEHRDILGALMSIGLRREKFGDIIIDENKAQLIVATEVADFVEWNIQTIGKATVRLNRISLSEHIIPKDGWEEHQTTVSSMRLDVVLAGMYNLSRSKVSPYIEKGLVKVNWKVITSNSFVLKEGDIISIRGYGRSFVQAIDGITKKGKFRIRFGRK